MPKDKLAGRSGELSSLSLEKSEGEGTFKKTVSTYLEGCIDRSNKIIARLDHEIGEKGRESGLSGWFKRMIKEIFGFGKSSKNKINKDARMSETVDDGIKESGVSSGHEESMRNKMKEAGYRSVVENESNEGIENNSEKDKSSDMQQNQ